MGLTGLLGQILLDAGIIGPETLDAALGRSARTKERLREALIAMRAVSKDDVLRSVAVQVGVRVFPYGPAVVVEMLVLNAALVSPEQPPLGREGGKATPVVAPTVTVAVGRGFDGSRSRTSTGPSERTMTTRSALIASSRDPPALSPTAYPKTFFDAGSSR
jgi:hypothetical protein